MSASTAPATGRMSDTHAGFGVVSRSFHWIMALLIAWQFVTAVAHAFAGGTALSRFLFATHYSVGFTIFVLVLLRGAWGLLNLSNRPPHAGGRFERLAANAGQTVLYLLMIGLPLGMLYRTLASGHGLKVYGLQLVAPAADPTPWRAFETVETIHVVLGWTFLAFIVVHAGLALYHGYIRRDATLDRMVKGASAKPLNP